MYITGVPIAAFDNRPFSYSAKESTSSEVFTLFIQKARLREGRINHSVKFRTPLVKSIFFKEDL